MNVTIWWRWWAIAAVAHVVGVPTAGGISGRGLANIAVGWLAIAVIVRPDHRTLRTSLAVAIVISAVVEAPLIGNHWWLAAAVSAAALLARPWRPDPDTSTDPGSTADAEFARRFAPTARVVLLVFYSFAAFAKLNTGFLDPVESCARFFANQSLSFWQLPEVSGDSPVAPVLPYIALVVELAVPVLLILRPTRRFGVILAIVFHLILTLDLRQHFYDFTLVLVPLFALFAPPRLLEGIDRSLPRLTLGGGRPWIALFAAQVAVFHLPVPDSLRGVAVVLGWATWMVLAWFIVRGLVRPPAEPPDASDGEAGIETGRGGQGPFSLRPVGVAGIGLVALAVLNGLSPYLELKTATGFNMYANLLTGDGATNHLVIPRTAELRDGQSSTVEILSSDDDGLDQYADSGFALPVANLRHYLADHPELSVRYRFDGDIVDHRPGQPGPLTPASMGWAQERFALFRAVPIDDPPACQNAWLPAR